MAEQKIALITDSTSDIPKSHAEAYGIEVVPMRIVYKNEEFLEGVNITSEEVYARFAEEVPKTSTPALGDIESVFQGLVDKGYTHAVIVTVSSGLSGTFNNFRIIAEEFSDKITSFVCDSKMLSREQSDLIEYAGELIKKGKDFSYISEALIKLRDRCKLFFTLDTLEFLMKGGRIGKVSGTIGELLKIKPIITMDENGAFTNFEKVRGSKQSFRRMTELATEWIAKGKTTVHIVHGGALEAANRFKEVIENLPNVQSIDITHLGPTIGVHTGPGVLAFALTPETED